MKKKIISSIIAITFCFNPIVTKDLLVTNVSANNSVQINIALQNPTVGGSYEIVLTDESYNTITQTIKTSQSIASFNEIDLSKTYTITVTHTSNSNELYYHGKHTFTTEDYGTNIYLNITDTPIERHTFTRNNESLITQTSKVTVAGAYANLNPISNIYSNYITPFISTDFKFKDILTTFSMNGFVTGDEYAILNVDIFTDLPEYYAVAMFDRYNNIQAIYYNTNAFPITRTSDTSLNLYLNDFVDTKNFAVIELEPQNEIEYNFTTTSLSNYIVDNYKNIETSYNNKMYSTTNHLTTGNIPTTGYISEFRNVSIGDVINLDTLNISGVSGWYYDIVHKNQVLNTSSVTVTKDILMNGLYPKFSSSSLNSLKYVFVK